MGDLVFFAGRRANGAIGHVGIVTEVTDKNSFTFIHASTRRGIVESNYPEETYYRARYRGARRIIDSNIHFVAETELYDTIAEEAAGVCDTLSPDIAIIQPSVELTAEPQLPTVDRTPRQNGEQVVPVESDKALLPMLYHKILPRNKRSNGDN